MFRSTRRQFAFNLHWQRSEGVQQSESLTDSRNPITPASWHPNGEVVAFIENNPPWASARAIARTCGLVGFDGRAFDLHPDGNRAIGAWAPESAPLPVQNTVILAFNFFEELRRLAPTTQ
jgi:hypothetical protein